jgi:hypothetical protein
LGEDHAAWVKEAKEVLQRLWDIEYRHVEILLLTEVGPVVKKRKTKLSSFEKFSGILSSSFTAGLFVRHTVR